MRISVVVRARNEAEHLPRLIEGLAAQTTQPFEVVLVDSGSSDDTVNIAKQAGWVVNRIPPGDFTFGRALNLGCSIARGEILAIMSAHVYPVRRDYLENLTATLERNSELAVYGRQVGDERTHFSERMIMKQWFPEQRILDQGHAFSNNANSAIPRSLWKKLRYNEDLTGLEDIDFSLRLLKMGGQIHYEHNAPVVHVHEENYSSVKHRYYREALAYKRIFPGENLSMGRALTLWFRNISRDIAEASRQAVLTRVWRSIFWFRSAQFYGAWSGFRDSSITESDSQRRMYHPPGNKPSSDLDLSDSEMTIDYSH